MNLKFYMTPGSCSTGIHILLEELEQVFEAYIVNIPRGDNRQPEYLAINPKGTIPTLVLSDGTSLTEFQSIAYYLAITNPGAAFLPEEPVAQAKILEIMAFVVNTVHGQGFARIFATENFRLNETDDKAIKDQGMKIVLDGFDVIDKALVNNLATGFTIADAALFYVEFWANKLNIPLPDHCQSHHSRMMNRPVIRRVLQEEGYY